MTRKQTAAEAFRRKDIKFGPADKRMCHNMTSAGTEDKALRQQASRRERGGIRSEFNWQLCTSAAEQRRG